MLIVVRCREAGLCPLPWPAPRRQVVAVPLEVIWVCRLSLLLLMDSSISSLVEATALPTLYWLPSLEHSEDVSACWNAFDN